MEIRLERMEKVPVMAKSPERLSHEEIVEKTNEYLAMPTCGTLRDEAGRKYHVMSWSPATVKALELGVVRVTVELQKWVAYKESE